MFIIETDHETINFANIESIGLKYDYVDETEKEYEYRIIATGAKQDHLIYNDIDRDKAETVLFYINKAIIEGYTSIVIYSGMSYVQCAKNGKFTDEWDIVE